MGLTISSQLVALMNGRIWVDSELGQGSRFFFTAHFGLVTESDRPAQNTPQKIERSLTEEPERRLRVLVVEDNLVNQRLARAVLEKAGHVVTLAVNGRAAIDKLDEIRWEIDAVLMDVQMPILDGISATREIRQLERSRGGRVPIIALTAHALDRDRERCLDAGMDDYLSKPIQAPQLLAALADLTSQSLVGQ